MTKQLHDYQRKAVEYIKEKKRCALFLDLGLGKTVTTLTAIKSLISEEKVKRVLIVAPLRVASTVWHSEVKEWEHLKDLKVVKALGSPSNRLKALEDKNADVVVINRENITWLASQSNNLLSFDFLVIDESSSFKSASTQRHKSIRSLAKASSYCLLLSATPAPNSFLDLWAQFQLLDGGVSLGTSFYKFRDKYCYPDRLGYIWRPRPGAVEDVQKRIENKTLSMTAEDYLTLPDKIYLNHYIDLPPKALTAYNTLESGLFLELGDKEVNASNSAVLAGKLLQMTAGAVYVDSALVDGNTQRSYEVIHNSKIEALAEIIESSEGESVLVCYNFKSDLMRLREAFPDAEVFSKDSSETVTRWNNGEIKILLVHPAAAGHGLNLQKGGSLIVFFSMTWSLELYQQVIGRLHRQGQDKPVRIIHILARDTLDERIERVITKRGVDQSQLINSLKYKG